MLIFDSYVIFKILHYKPKKSCLKEGVRACNSYVGYLEKELDLTSKPTISSYLSHLKTLRIDFCLQTAMVRVLTMYEASFVFYHFVTNTPFYSDLS